MKSYTTKSPEETESIGFKLAQTLRGGEVIAFRGGLGMGKTCFTRLYGHSHIPYLCAYKRIYRRQTAALPF